VKQHYSYCWVAKLLLFPPCISYSLFIYYLLSTYTTTPTNLHRRWAGWAAILDCYSAILRPLHKPFKAPVKSSRYMIWSMLDCSELKENRCHQYCCPWSIVLFEVRWTTALRTVVYLSADADTTNTYLLMSLKQVQHASNGCINIQITAHAIAIGQAMARTIIQNKA
jgi:hypothetical protein